MKIDDMLDNFDWDISISEKGKVKLTSKSSKTSNRKTMVQRKNSNEETAKSDEECPLQFAPSDLHILLRSSKNNQAVQHKKSSKNLRTI